MKLYLKIVGYLALVDWLIGIILFLLYMGKNFSKFDGASQALLIIILITLIVIGPALGLLFISHSDLVEDNESLNNKLEEFINDSEKEKDKMIRKQALMEHDLEDIKRNNKN